MSTGSGTPPDGRYDPRHLDPVLGFMRALWEVDHALFSASKRMKAKLGVTGPERLVLRVVGEMPDISPGQLADILHLHPSTVTAVLHRLVRRKLVARSVDARDTRRAHLRLTAAGEALDAVRAGTIESGVRSAIDRLPGRDLRTTVEVLRSLSVVLNGLKFERRGRGSATATGTRRAASARR